VLPDPQVRNGWLTEHASASLHDDPNVKAADGKMITRMIQI
jgi:hypothetical protein